jgi:hypothetical protein
MAYRLVFIAKAEIRPAKKLSATLPLLAPSLKRVSIPAAITTRAYIPAGVSLLTQRIADFA